MQRTRERRVIDIFLKGSGMTQQKARLSVSFFLLFSTVSVFSQTYYVAPAQTGNNANSGLTTGFPFATVQYAINSAVTGDSIILLDGTYSGVGNRDINFSGKEVAVQSLNGASAVTIDCQSLGRGFILQNDEGSGAIIDGITIINGYTTSGGGGIYADTGSTPMILNCIIEDCHSDLAGGGIYLVNFLNTDVSLIENCEIRNCEARKTTVSSNTYGGCS